MLQTALLMLTSAFVGYIVRSLLPGWNLWETRWAKDRRARAAYEALDRELRANAGHLTVGRFTVADIAGVQVFTPPLTADELTSQFNAEAILLPADLQELEFSYLKEREALQKRQGQVVDFNPTYALRGLRIERPQIEGERRNRPVMIFEPSNYKYYLMCNAALDLPVLEGGSGKRQTIRARYLSEMTPFDWSCLTRVPFHMWFATVTAVITADQQLVVTLRSDMQGITDSRTAGVWRGAMSAAEGMLRPKDSRTPPPREEPTPFVTSARALCDELGLIQGTHFTDRDIRLLALAFDLKRFQPLGVFLVQLSSTTFAELREVWQVAKDRQESKEIVGIPVTSHDISLLLNNKHRYLGRVIELFSNHQRLGMLLSALHLLGTPSVTAALKRRTG